MSFPCRDLGEGFDSEGTIFIFCPAMMFIVDRNSVKYSLHTQNHTPRGYEGTSLDRVVQQGVLGMGFRYIPQL
jgi:hypothetical protein